MTPLNTNELAAALGLHPSTLSRIKKTHRAWVQQFEVARPIGQRRYAPAKVAAYLAGKSLVRIGAGSRRAS